MVDVKRILQPQNQVKPLETWVFIIQISVSHLIHYINLHYGAIKKISGESFDLQPPPNRKKPEKLMMKFLLLIQDHLEEILQWSSLPMLDIPPIHFKANNTSYISIS